MGEETKSELQLSGALGAGKTAAVSYQSATSLAQIYNVSDIMQFGHAAMYRLCEAAADKFLTPSEYVAQLSDVLRTMRELLRVQAQAVVGSAYAPLANARATLDDLEAEKAVLESRLMTSADTARQKELSANAKRTKEEQSELENLNAKAEAAGQVRTDLDDVSKRITAAQANLEAVRSDLLKRTAVEASPQKKE
jgi:hypothetical protein